MNKIEQLKLDRDLAWTDYYVHSYLDRNSADTIKAKAIWMNACTDLIRALNASNNYGVEKQNDRL